MTAEIVNLRRARKAKARAEAGREAEANRLLFGRSGAEKARTAAERARGDAVLDGHRLDGHPLDAPPPKHDRADR